MIKVVEIKIDENGVLLKKCTGECGEFKTLDEFYSNKIKSYGKESKCKKCTINYARKFYKKNKSAILEKQKIYVKKNYTKVCNSHKKYRKNNKQKIKELDKKYRIEKKEYIKNRKQNYCLINKNKIANYMKCYYIKNKNNILKYKRDYDCKRKSKDFQYKIKKYLRTRLNIAFKYSQKNGSAIKDLGCSIEELKIWLSQFFYTNKETGIMMTFENYGYYGWHIDHHIPLSFFDLNNKDDVKKACHYTNLRPLWAKDNLSKGAKIIEGVSMSITKSMTVRDLLTGGEKTFDPMSLDTSEIRELSNALPRSGEIDINVAEILANKFLRGADMCSELLAIATCHASKTDTERKKAYSKAAIEKASAAGIKTDKARILFADADDDYIIASNKHSEAVAFVKWISSKADSFVRGHYMCKKMLDRHYSQEKTASFNFSNEKLANENSWIDKSEYEEGQEENSDNFEKGW